MNSISRETFESMNTDSKLNILFDYTVEIHKKVKEFENRKRVDKAMSILGGAVGGFIAITMKYIFWRN